MRCRTGTSGHHSRTTFARTVIEKVIQEFVEKETLAKQQIEEDRDKIKDFEAELPRSE
jgi:hypothetical protein